MHFQPLAGILRQRGLHKRLLSPNLFFENEAWRSVVTGIKRGARIGGPFSTSIKKA
jgi:hypothetical protein